MNFLYVCTPKDLSYTNYLRGCVPPVHSIITKNSQTTYLYEITQTIEHIAKAFSKQIHGIILSDPHILNKYLQQAYGAQINAKDPGTLHKYQGAMFAHTIKLENGVTYSVPVVVITPPEHLVYDQSKKFLSFTYISKLWDKTFFTAPKLTWTKGSPENLPLLYQRFSDPSTILISLDIETVNMEVDPSLVSGADIDGVPVHGMTYFGHAKTAAGGKAARYVNLFPAITMVGYTAIFQTERGLESHTVVIPFNDPECYAWIKKFNQLPAPKVMHNGRYDNTWLFRFNAPVFNWVYDTYGLMHSWYVELPRTLAATSALVIRNHMFWKDESSSNLPEYCAKDCHATAWACVAMLRKMPDWAIHNYVMVFKQVFPAMTCALEGFKENEEESKKLWAKYKADIAANEKWWSTAIVPYFNIGSHVQVKKLFIDLLDTGVKSTNAKELDGILHKHPLWRMFVEKLQDAREAKKADSTYMNIELFCGRILYSLDPFGTTSTRYASKASEFWCGTQIQNIPGYAKSKFEFDEGYVGVSCDGKQAESRTTAYITGEEKMIDAVENSKDFHTRNASGFFGISEEELWEMKKSNPALYTEYRSDVGKRINHGANYNMMENTLIATMTPLRVIKAKVLLKLPANWTLFKVAGYLLSCFDKLYPKVRSKEPGGYHHYVIETVKACRRLVTPLGWTRYTFLNPGPEKSQKLDLNALVAHLPQATSVQIINRAFFKTWYQLQLIENKIRIKAQIHDEILYQTKPDFVDETIAYTAKALEEPVEVNGRTMVIPTDPKSGAKFWKDLKD